MATYNGAAYVSKQIDSILGQVFADWHLYVHDDGSNDETVAIVERYERQYPHQITILRYPSQGGACNNFFSLLANVDAPYYMFCDQDDYWDANKVGHSYLKMKETEQLHPDVPVLVHCNLRIVDEALNVIHESFWDVCQLHPEIYHTLAHRVSSIIPGCTILINDLAKHASGDATAAIMHDYWLTVRTLAAGGKVVPLDEILMSYRQHSANTVGVESCYKDMTIGYKLTHLPYLIGEHKKTYRMLRAAGYGSVPTYILNKVREFVLFHIAEYKKRNEKMTIVRRLRLIAAPVLNAIGKCIYLVWSYRVRSVFYNIYTLFYSAWIRNTFAASGTGVIYYPSVTVRGGKYVRIGNMTAIGRHGVITAWNLVDGITPDLRIGNSCDIGEYVHLSCANAITIGDGVLFGRWVTVIDNSHGSLCDEQKDMSPIVRPVETKGPVVIEDNVWIGDKVTILPGTHIGRGSIIAANSVVSKDIPPYCVAGGIPAKVIKSLITPEE